VESGGGEALRKKGGVPTDVKGGKNSVGKESGGADGGLGDKE